MVDIERKRRSLCIRENIIARRFVTAVKHKHNNKNIGSTVLQFVPDALRAVHRNLQIAAPLKCLQKAAFLDSEQILDFVKGPIYKQKNQFLLSKFY